MLRALLAFGLIFATAVNAGPVEKIPPKAAIAVEPLHPMYLGSINTGLKVNDAYTEGNFSIVAPVWSSLGAEGILSGSLFFIEPYISWGEQGEVASSIGLGFRHLIGRQPVDVLTKHDGHQASFLEEGVVLGGNLFVDMLDTETDHRFWQLGVGAEVLTRYVEVRGNYYIPLSDKQEVGTVRTQETFQTTSQQSSSVAGDSFATGNSILQPYSQITTQTTTTTTIERLFRRYEEGMEGWDVEVGLLLPWIDRYMDAKVIGGYYSFDNQPFGPQTGGAGNVEGWKAGLELRPVPAVVLNGTWYDDERLTGSDWTVSARLEIPFEAGDYADGKNLWSRVGDAFKPRRRHLIERMAEPVRRQNAAVKIARSTEEDEEEQQTNVRKVTKVVSQSQGQLVLADDVVFVNDGPAAGNGIQAGSATGNGTAERPVLTIQEGADLAGPRSTSSGRVWSVYTQGQSKSYLGNVMTTGSTNFIGSGKLIPGAGGKSFGNGPAPFLDGGFILENVNTVGVAGYVITGNSAAGVGVRATDVQNLVLDSNHFIGGDNAILVSNFGASTTSLVAIRNSLSGTNAAISLNTMASGINAFVAGNTFSGNAGDAIVADTNSDSHIALVATNNVFFDNQGSAFNLLSQVGSTLNVAASGNVISHHGGDAFTLASSDTATLIATIRDNIISDVDLAGVYAEATISSTMDLKVTGNVITRVGDAGIDVSTCGCLTGLLKVSVLNNQISSTFGPGIAVGNLGDTATMEATISGNRVIESMGPAGIFLMADGGTNNTATVTNNVVQSVNGYGVVALGGLSSTTSLVLNGNVTSFTAASGIGLSVGDTATMNVTSFARNSVSFADFDGVELMSFGATLDIKNFNGNSINQSTDNNLFLDASMPGSVLKLNGTTNNSFGVKGLSHADFFGTPEGTLILNGGSVTLPATVP